MTLKFLAALWRKPTALEIAVRDLEEAKRKHLEVMSASEYYESQARYYDGMILRLTTYVKENAE